MSEEVSQETAPQQETKGASSRRLPVGVEVLLVFLVGLGAAFVKDVLVLAVLGGGSMFLVYRHRERPADVVGIVFSMHCMTPFLRRIYDLNHGYHPGSMILISSYCAYPVLGLTLVRSLHKFKRLEFLPLVLGAFGVAWAYTVGVLKSGIVPASIQLLQYSSGPFVFGYLTLNAAKLEVPRVLRWLLALGIIEAIYGIYQWISPPPWDVAWFMGVGAIVAGGIPEPFKMRTFGTLNIVSPYSYFLAYCLVLTVEFSWVVPATVLMVAALATTQARSAWGTVLVGWTASLIMVRLKEKSALFSGIAASVLLLITLALPFADRLEAFASRINSIRNIQGDSSFQARTKLMEVFFESGVLDPPEGTGMGATGAAAQASAKAVPGLDNGFLQTIWIYGWIGSSFYLGGFFVALFAAVRKIGQMDRIHAKFAGVSLALFVANIFESSFDDMKGAMLWAAVGIAAGLSNRKEGA
ncbi:MAG TPA: O-antigen ligase family protein [Fibrobacteria bacterium]|nr:O-antigen ligase family protein [Fibrobacteria bacterium]